MARRLIWLAAMAGPALAAPPTREVCPSLSGLDTGACTTEPGQLVAEVLPVDLEHDRQDGETTDTLRLGRALLRAGVGPATEVQVEWLPYGRVRERTDRVTRHGGRPGDARLGLRQNLRHPDGHGFAVALEPSVTIPVGRRPVGAGDWGAGLVAVVSFDIGETLSVTLDPEAEAAVDEDGDGRHLAYGGVISLAAKLSDAVQAQLDYEGQRDRDPAGHLTSHRAGLSLVWQPDAAFAVFATAAAALDHDAPDSQLFIGVARRF